MAGIADEVFAVQEGTTVLPGEVADAFSASPVMNTYMQRVRGAEKKLFGAPRLSPKNVRTLNLRMGDLSRLELSSLTPALDSDAYIVFGASWIRGLLAQALVERKAINIHMGVSPYYRGSSCNFWALYDGNADLVGATIHLLSKGLDNGDMLYHALPVRGAYDPFDLGMRAVYAAHDTLAARLKSGELFNLSPVAQNKQLEFRYTRNDDFNDAVATEYLSRNLMPADVERMLTKAPLRHFTYPLFG